VEGNEEWATDHCDFVTSTAFWVGILDLSVVTWVPSVVTRSLRCGVLVYCCAAWVHSFSKMSPGLSMTSRALGPLCGRKPTMFGSAVNVIPSGKNTATRSVWLNLKSYSLLSKSRCNSLADDIAGTEARNWPNWRLCVGRLSCRVFLSINQS
jgi:hypothetical protein